MAWLDGMLWVCAVGFGLSLGCIYQGGVKVIRAANGEDMAMTMSI